MGTTQKCDFMDNDTKPQSPPEKVVRRHADMLNELLPEITTLVTEEGRPADALLARHLKVHKELGSRDRRFLSQAVFSYFRWYGWTINKLKLPVAEAAGNLAEIQARCAARVSARDHAGRSAHDVSPLTLPLGNA